MRYNCHVCGCTCDPGELENGVCFDCRKEASEVSKKRTMNLIRDWNKLVKSQSDGQMVLEV